MTQFEHRRCWVEARLLELAEIFVVERYACAIMSNHVARRVAHRSGGRPALDG